MSMIIDKRYQAKMISYGRIREAKEIAFIVIHATGNETDTAIANAKYFAFNNTRSAGAHYFVDDDLAANSIDDLRVAWSVGGKPYADCDKTGGGSMYGKITNVNSISIEMCSTKGKISDKTLANTIELTKMLMTAYNIPAENVYRHFDVNGKPCPYNDGWTGKTSPNWDNFKSMLVEKPKTKKTYSGTYPSGVIKKGSKGSEVKKLQKYLNWYADFSLAIDGDCGTKTVTAIKTFQKNEKLTVDGIWGAKSLAAAKKVKR